MKKFLNNYKDEIAITFIMFGFAASMSAMVSAMYRLNLI